MDKHGDKPKKSVGIKMLGAVCSLALIVSMGVIVIAGSNTVAALVLMTAVGGLAGPSVVAGEGIVDCLSGMLDMFIEGVTSVVTMIVDAISSIFG